MKTRLCVGMIALLCAGYAQATCGPIMVSPAPTLPGLVVDQPLVDVSAPAWQADEVYQKGDIVLHTDGLYQARWWTQNEAPGPTWASWELLTRENAQWRSSAVYNQGDTALYNGKLYQAQYWTQGQVPSDGGPWLETQTSKKLLAANFIQESYDCGAPPQMNPDGSYYYTRNYLRSISLATEMTDEVIFDTVRFSPNGAGKIELITAVIDGQTCKGQAACNTLLNGEEKQVSYYSIATKSWSKTYGSVMPTPTPIPTPIPNFEQVEAIDEFESLSMMPPTLEPTPMPEIVLVCNDQDICRQVIVNL
ncbi:carbohydrate-binding protein [Motilimonas cestriensis]|uniref:carbohydrate-binding protein n=1 Tax=Motilimonas cestriensis TaxID=2742685 RepID=UPI003DA2F173